VAGARSILNDINEGRVSIVKIAIWLTALTIINGVYGNMGNQATITFAKIYRYIMGDAIALKQPVLKAVNNPIIKEYLKHEANRLKRHVHAVLESLSSRGFLEHDKKHYRYIIKNTSILWYIAMNGNVNELYKTIARIITS